MILGQKEREGTQSETPRPISVAQLLPLLSVNVDHHVIPICNLFPLFAPPTYQLQTYKEWITMLEFKGATTDLESQDCINFATTNTRK
jgi:hypothetical protein